MPKQREFLYDSSQNQGEDLRSRSDQRRERKEGEEQLMGLAVTLTKLSQRLLARLPLSDEIQSAIQEIHRIESAVARQRALRAVRIALRAADAEAIQRELSALLDPSRSGPSQQAIDGWRDRLLAAPEAEFSAFLRQYPKTDRQELWQAVRRTLKAGEATRNASLRSLNKVLRRYLELAAQSSNDLF